MRGEEAKEKVMLKFQRTPWRVLSLAAAALIFVGCEAKLTSENYARIKPGMTLAEVQTVLGSSGREDSSPTGMTINDAGIAGSSKESDERIFLWEEDGVAFTVVFKDDKVVETRQSGL
jgi:hypothetical protein